MSDAKWYQAVRDLNWGELPEGESFRDRTTNAIKTVPYEHYEIHVGSHYFIYTTIDIPADDWLDIQIVTPNTTRWAHFVPYVASEAGIDSFIYEGVTILQAGTAITPLNRNRNSANTSGLTFASIINTSEANANLDTSIEGALLIGAATSGSGRNVGGEVEGRNEIILKQNTAYSIRIHSLDNTATKYVNLLLTWYEHTNKDT
jgi:hypothetical protein